MVGMVLNSTQMTVLQGINISLGTTAFVAMTSNISNAVSQASSILGIAALGLYTAFLIFWVAKIFIQNHISFASGALGSGYRIFQLFITIISFLLLIVACEQVSDFGMSSSWLLAHFVVLMMWLVGLAIHLGRTLDPKLFPWHWAVVPVVGITVVLFLRAVDWNAVYAMSLFAGIMFVAAIYDARVSRTFAD